MRILVTGVTGQVGAALMTRLAGRGELHAASRAEIDLARPAEIAAKLDRIGPDLIVNPAAYTAVDRAEDERELAHTVNAEAPAALAAWAARRGVPLVHFSTDYVFDGSGNAAWRETDRADPLNEYGKSKLAGEQAIRAADGAHLIVRTAWVYDATGNNFLRTMTRLMREREELRIVTDQIGGPTSAAAIADVVARIIELSRGRLSEAFAAANGVLHVAAAGETSWHGFATAIAEGLRHRGVPLALQRLVAIPSAQYPTKAARPKNSRLDLSRLRELFGIETQDWRLALEPELDRVAADVVDVTR